MTFETAQKTETTARTSVRPFALAVMIPDPQVFPDLRPAPVPHLHSADIIQFRPRIRRRRRHCSAVIRDVYDWRADPDFDPSTAFYDDDPDIEAYYAALEAEDDDPYVSEQRAEEAAEGYVPPVDEDEGEQDVELIRALAWERYCREVGIDPND